MNYEQIRDEIQFLGYRATFDDFTTNEEQRLLKLLEQREACPTYLLDKAKSNAIINRFKNERSGNDGPYINQKRQV